MQFKIGENFIRAKPTNYSTNEVSFEIHLWKLTFLLSKLNLKTALYFEPKIENRLKVLLKILQSFLSPRQLFLKMAAEKVGVSKDWANLDLFFSL